MKPMEKDIYYEITKAFGALWHCRPRGESLEISTPVPTSTSKFVTVFLTYRDDKWIVSDGGMTGKGMYDNPSVLDNPTYDKVLEFFLEDFEIKKTRNKRGEILYYKSTTRRELVPNIVFDLSNFISIVVNDSLIDYREKRERRLFSTAVRQFLTQTVETGELKFNAPLNNKLSIRFGVVALNDNGRASLVNYVTGTTEDYMNKSLAQSKMYYDRLAQSQYRDSVNNQFVLINDKATGYSHDSLEPYIEICRKDGQIPVVWSTDRFSMANSLSA